jgi:hypothetical protein
MEIYCRCAECSKVLFPNECDFWEMVWYFCLLVEDL